MLTNQSKLDIDLDLNTNVSIDSAWDKLNGDSLCSTNQISSINPDPNISKIITTFANYLSQNFMNFKDNPNQFTNSKSSSGIKYLFE